MDPDPTPEEWAAAAERYAHMALEAIDVSLQSKNLLPLLHDARLAVFRALQSVSMSSFQSAAAIAAEGNSLGGVLPGKPVKKKNPPKP